jgi:hypothetical protein
VISSGDHTVRNVLVFANKNSPETQIFESAKDVAAKETTVTEVSENGFQEIFQQLHNVGQSMSLYKTISFKEILRKHMYNYLFQRN